jgi:hypothetical protein
MTKEKQDKKGQDTKVTPRNPVRCNLREMPAPARIDEVFLNTLMFNSFHGFQAMRVVADMLEGFEKMLSSWMLVCKKKNLRFSY